MHASTGGSMRLHAWSHKSTPHTCVDISLIGQARRVGLQAYWLGQMAGGTCVYMGGSTKRLYKFTVACYSKIEDTPCLSSANRVFILWLMVVSWPRGAHKLGLSASL